MSRIGRFVETENRIEAIRASREEGYSYCLMGTVSVWNDEEVLEMGSGDGWTTLCIFKATELYT